MIAIDAATHGSAPKTQNNMEKTAMNEATIRAVDNAILSGANSWT